MDDEKGRTGQVDSAALERILEVTRQLARGFELNELLQQVVDAGRKLLTADRGTVFLYDADKDELVAAVATGVKELRVPASKGIVGEVVRTREIVNVPDCYADSRFNPEMDRKSGYKTRCLLTIPLIGYDDSMVGVLQLLNKANGVFNDADEQVATALAAQCAVALQRAKMTEQLLAKERVDRELAVAREIQMGFIPKKMPVIERFDVGGLTRPAEETGGDTFDLIPRDDGRLFVLLGDATGHGVGPALSVAQVRSMLRIAVMLDADFESTFININQQLCNDLPPGRFVTGFLGVLEPDENRIRYHSGGQGPLLHFHAKTGKCEWFTATTFPMGMLPGISVDERGEWNLEPGDIAGVITDGVFETEDPQGEMYGEERVAEVLNKYQELPMAELCEKLFAEVTEFGKHAPQADDITIVFVRRTA